MSQPVVVLVLTGGFMKSCGMRTLAQECLVVPVGMTVL
jgi:hypothetical protein